jgi:site-specific DNA-cytosine methylase
VNLVLSLFPGIGLLDHAFGLEGFCAVRGPDPIWGGDIRTFHVPSGRFDGVIGGPPCQMFSSLARLVEANGHNPTFGNLFPEFERVVVEAQPDWFVCENVPQAPQPVCMGYGTKAILLDNSALAGGFDGEPVDGYGQEQRRVRRFTFGLRGVADADVPALTRWIDLACFLLPDATGTQWTPDNSKEAKRRTTAVSAGHEQPDGLTERKRSRKRTVTALGPDHLQGLRESTERVRQATVSTTFAGDKPNEQKRLHETINGSHDRAPSARVKAVSGSNGGNGSQRQTTGAGNKGRGRYKLADALRLQGLAPDFLKHCPFTAEGALKAVANGVPIVMGRAIARAVKDALVWMRAEGKLP